MQLRLAYLDLVLDPEVRAHGYLLSTSELLA